MSQMIEAPLAAAGTQAAISVDSAGVARIAGTRIKVSQITLEYGRLGWTRERIASSHPHLSAAQVSAALAFYDNHREAIEEQIEASLTYADQAQREAGPTALTTKLQAAVGRMK